MLWTEKYKPTNTKDVLTFKTIVSAVQNSLRDNSSSNCKPVMISGPIGIGKSTLVEIIVKQMHWHITLVDPELTVKKLQIIFSNRRLDGKFCFVLDNADSYESLSNVTSALSHLRCPLFIICVDPYDKHLRTLKSKCECLSVRPPTELQIRRRLENICLNENIEFEDSSQLSTFISNGDLRHAIIQLQFSDFGEDADHRDNLFTATSQILKRQGSLSERASMVCSDLEMSSAMAFENYLESKADIADIAASSECFSRADVISRHHRETAGSLIAQSAPRKGKSILKFPRFPMMYGKASIRFKNEKALKFLSSYHSGLSTQALVNVLKYFLIMSETNSQYGGTLFKAYYDEHVSLDTLESSANLKLSKQSRSDFLKIIRSHSHSALKQKASKMKSSPG